MANENETTPPTNAATAEPVEEAPDVEMAPAKTKPKRAAKQKPAAANQSPEAGPVAAVAASAAAPAAAAAAAGEPVAEPADVEMGAVQTKSAKRRGKKKAAAARQAATASKAGEDGAAVPNFKALSAKALKKSRKEIRKIPVPPHRLTPIRQDWMQIYEPIVTHLKLQIRMNLRTKCVEVKEGKNTEHVGALQKAADFVKAIVLGFSVADSIAIVRLDDLYVETFEVRDIRSTLKGDHLARAVGRIAGKDGRTKFTIENATKTRIVVADTRIHILGSFENIRLARHSISSLVLGTAPGKVYNKLRTVSARMNERKF